MTQHGSRNLFDNDGVPIDYEISKTGIIGSSEVYNGSLLDIWHC